MKKFKLLVIFCILSKTLLANVPNAMNFALEDGQKQVVNLLNSTENNSYLLSYLSFLIKYGKEEKILSLLNKNQSLLQEKNIDKLILFSKEFSFFSKKLFDKIDLFIIKNQKYLDKKLLVKLIDFYGQSKRYMRNISILEELGGEEYKLELIQSYISINNYKKAIILINNDSRYLVEGVFSFSKLKNFIGLKNFLKNIFLAEKKLKKVLFNLYIYFLWQDISSAKKIREIILEKETKSAPIIKSLDLIDLFKNNKISVLEDKLQKNNYNLPYLDYIYFLLTEYYYIKNNIKKSREYFSFIKGTGLWKKNPFYFVLKQLLFLEDIEKDLPLIKSFFRGQNFNQDKILLAMLLLKNNYKKAGELKFLLKKIDEKSLKTQLALLLLSYSPINNLLLEDLNLEGLEELQIIYHMLKFDLSENNKEKKDFLEYDVEGFYKKTRGFEFLYNNIEGFWHNYFLYFKKKRNLLFKDKLTAISNLLISDKKSFLNIWYEKIITWQNLFLIRDYESLDREVKQFLILEKDNIKQVNNFEKNSYFFAHYYLLLESSIAQRNYDFARDYIVRLETYTQFPEQKVLLLARKAMIYYLQSFKGEPIIFLQKAENIFKKLIEKDFIPKMKYVHFYRLAKIYHRLSLVDKKNEGKHFSKYVNLLQQTFNKISISDKKLFLRIAFELIAIYKKNRSKYSIKNIFNSLREKGFIEK